MELITRLCHLVGFGIILQKPAVCCMHVPVGVHTPSPKYPSGDWRLLSRSRSRRYLNVTGRQLDRGTDNLIALAPRPNTLRVIKISNLAYYRDVQYTLNLMCAKSLFIVYIFSSFRDTRYSENAVRDPVYFAVICTTTCFSISQLFTARFYAESSYTMASCPSVCLSMTLS